MEDYDIDRICRFLENIERNTSPQLNSKEVDKIKENINTIRHELQLLNAKAERITHYLQEIYLKLPSK